MTDDKLDNIARAFGTVIAVIIVLLALVAYSFGQPEKPDSSHDHETMKLERFRLIRILPAKVTYVEKQEFGTRIEYVTRDNYEIENGYFTATKETKGDVIKKDQWFFFIYCESDRYLYGAYYPTPEQKKGLK